MVAFVVSALVVLVTLWGQARSQVTCGWEQSSYTVNEGANIISITAEVTGSTSNIILQYATRDGTAVGTYLYYNIATQN